jgi:hypothetical protein
MGRKKVILKCESTPLEFHVTHFKTNIHIELILYQESPRESGRFGVEWDTSAIDLCG